MDINYIGSFLAIVRYGSFQNAAQELFISQPSLTARIQNLENELGKKMFIRNKSGATLTEDGQIFYSYAQQLMDLYEMAKMEVGKLPKEITIGATMSASTQLLPKIISELKRDKPHLTVKVLTGFTVDLVSRVENGDCSFAITQEFTKDGLVSIPFYKDPISLFAPKGHKFESAIVTLDQIAREPMIGLEMAIYWEQIEELFRANHLKLNTIFNINSLDACKSMVANGLGIAFMSELSLESAIHRGDICRIDTSPPMNLYRTLTIAYREGKELPPYLDHILNIMKRLKLSLDVTSPV